MIKNINKKTLVKIFKTSFALVSAGIVLLTPMSCTKAEEMPKQRDMSFLSRKKRMYRKIK